MTPSLPVSLSSTRLLSRTFLAAAAASGSLLLAACGGGAGDAAPAAAAQAASAPAGILATEASTATSAAPVDSAATGSKATASDAAQQDAMRTASLLSGTPGTAALSWKAVTNAVSYRVYYGTASRTYLQPLGAGVATASPTLSLSGLASGQTYWFAVTGVDASGLETAYSDETTALVP